MAGEEIIAVGKVVEAVGKKVLAEDEKTKDVLLRLAEGTPEMAAAARSLAVRTAIKERIKLKLYQPFARWIGVSKEYFEDTFPLEMAVKTANIPDENFITPPPSIVVPALQGLSYSFEEPSLKELYLNLLTTASDDRRTDQAHPAFAEIIRQLTSGEAKLLNDLLRADETAIVRIKISPLGIREQPLQLTHLLPIIDYATGQPREEPQAPMWVDNWQRLGLVSVSYYEGLLSADAYSWVEKRPEYLRLKRDLASRKIQAYSNGTQHGMMRVTDFGRHFLNAVSELAELIVIGSSDVHR
jgi:hypothetical protein